MTQRALLIGINYVDSPSNSLNGCWNDVQDMSKYLSTVKGVPDANIRVMLDNEPSKGTPNYPTKSNILVAMKSFISSAKPKDTLYIHYSGHGGQVPDKSKDETDGRDECIYGCDLKTITDDDLRATLIDSLPTGATLLGIFDCCHSGTGLDLPWLYLPTVGKTREGKDVTGKNVIMVSGCRDNQTSADAYIGSRFRGALTACLLDVLQTAPKGWTWREMITALQWSLHKKRYEQVPQLSFSDPLTAERVLEL